MRPIDRTSAQPIYRQIYEQFVEGITEGLYGTGTKLPSIRTCAQTLGVSNTTVELAYQELVADGYICARRGSGYTVCPLDK